MVKHACGDAGLFDHAVAVEQGGDPAQIQLVGLNRTTAEDHPRVGGVIGDGIEHLARALGFRVNVVAAGVDQLQRGDHVVRSVVDVEDGAVRAAQRFCQHKGQLHFDTRNDKAIDGNVAAVVEEHVVQQRAVVRLAYLGAGLHRFGGEADLVALQHASFGNLQADPFALDGVGVVDGDRRVVERDLADLLPGLFRLMQTMGDQGMGMFVEHGDILFYVCFLPLPVGEGRGEGIRPQRFPLTLTLSQRERGRYYLNNACTLFCL